MVLKCPVPVIPFAVNIQREECESCSAMARTVITGVGQRFQYCYMNSGKTLLKFAIANQFAFKYKKDMTSHPCDCDKCKSNGARGEFMHQGNKKFGWQVLHGVVKRLPRSKLPRLIHEAYVSYHSSVKRSMETTGSLATFTTKEELEVFIDLLCAVPFLLIVWLMNQGCRPLFPLIGNIFEVKKYQGNLLVATAADGNDSAFPVSFCCSGTQKS
nr:MuDR family transposase isoform 2 [Ipomoea batatas]